MTIARRDQLRLDITSHYHCITRCVRRAFLCGKDRVTGKNFDQRRGWIEQRLLLLCDTFCIRVAGYAVMSNHYHLVLQVDQKMAESLSDDQVIARWRQLYKGPEVIKRYLDNELLSHDEQNLWRNIVDQWRDNLTNISRFMGNLNEHIARRANREDNCKGRFWESRFKLQAILDMAALIRTLCYVDLNPVRAKMAKKPESSDYTSVKARLNRNKHNLLPFAKKTGQLSTSVARDEPATELPITFKDYLEILDWTGRELLRGKRGRISSEQPSIMNRLGYTPAQWMKAQTPRVSWMQKAVGQSEAINEYAAAIGQRWIWQSA